MTPAAAALLAGLGLLSGLLIGAIGIGGVILVPALVYLGGIPIHAAIAGAMAGYILTGIVGTLVYAREKSIQWNMVGWLWAGAMPAALAGALAASVAPAVVLNLLIGALALFSGLHTLLARTADDRPGATPISNRALGGIGAVTGFLSAVSGTGGPLILVPILLYLELPVLTAVGLSQVIQLPIALLATVGNLAYGNLDLVLGGSLAVGLGLGTWVGATVAHAVPRSSLRRMASLVLIIVGIAIFVRLAVHMGA